MAINETNVTGRYFRQCIDVVNKKWQRISYWLKACDLFFDDNSNAQTKVGAIKGITTDLNTTVTGYACDATVIKSLQDQIAKLKNR